MEWEKVAEKLRDMILGELKEEFRDFKASVTGELSGFRIAIEAINGRMNGIEARMSGIEFRLSALEERQNNLERRLDEMRAELKAEIAQNTMRIDELNKRIDELNKRVDTLYLEVAEIRGDLREALSRKEIIQDILFRIERLETKVG